MRSTYTRSPCHSLRFVNIYKIYCIYEKVRIYLYESFRKMKPADSELSILSVLWSEGPSTVRHVNEQLNKERRVGYTNTLKMMQLMHEKGMLSRDESSRSHVYNAQLQADEVRKDLLDHMVNSIFGGKTSNLLVHALGSYKPSHEELDEIRKLIDRLDNSNTE